MKGQIFSTLVAAVLATTGFSSPSYAQGQVVTVELPDITLTPVHTRGDNEYKGHGPRVDVSATLRPINGQLWARICMRAVESQEDFTTAEQCADYAVYNADGQSSPVVALAPGQDRKSSWQYVDTNEEVDISPSFPPTEPVRVFECYGDTQGEDAGASTQVTVRFNPIQLIIAQ
jgi:hypothetical protein